MNANEPPKDFADAVGIEKPQPTTFLTANGLGRLCRPQRCGERVKQIARELGIEPLRLSEGTMIFGPSETARIVAEVARRALEDARR